MNCKWVRLGLLVFMAFNLYAKCLLHPQLGLVITTARFSAV